jgi:hypothetical protein
MSSDCCHRQHVGIDVFCDLRSNVRHTAWQSTHLELAQTEGLGHLAVPHRIRAGNSIRNTRKQLVGIGISEPHCDLGHLLVKTVRHTLTVPHALSHTHCPTLTVSDTDCKANKALAL